MANLEMRDKDLQELYMLVQTYADTYSQYDITSDLQRDIERRCADKGIPCTASNIRNAGRKPNYDAATRDNIIAIYRRHDMTLRQIAEEVGVSYSTVQRIIADYRFSSKTQN